jgi:hypothetical protein
MGDSEGALSELLQAAPLAASSQDTRLSWLVLFACTGNLWQLRRYAEADALLPDLRKQALASGNELDVIRVAWLEGRVATGLKQRERALPALEQVRRYFTGQGIAYDAALASLEVAVLHLEEGKTAEVKVLAEEMLWIFKSQGVQKEALAALKLFCDAARQEAATVELARRVHAEVERAGRAG